jgi:hypothetical protein
VLRQLNGEGAHPARARVDQHHLPLPELRAFDQNLPAGQANEAIRPSAGRA